jgi:outer membrane protein assembly factor BamB
MKRMMVIAVVLLALLLLMMPSATVGDSGTGGSALIDMGDGNVYWYDFSGTGDCIATAAKAAEANGLSFEVSGTTVVSIGGLSAVTVGGQGCGWILYNWDGNAWKAVSVSEYNGGSFAWGYYSDGSVVPAVTPDQRSAWTMHRGDSASSGSSTSVGTKSAVVPVEWYRTYTTGFVDSSLIVAGNYLYHTTGGDYNSTGPNHNPWVYCLDRTTGEIVWSYMMTYGQGYEITSPVVVGDMLVVTATNWNVYCFDRFDGTLLHELTLEQRYPYDKNGDIVWKGRTFYTGATTPVYDSGALYFGTADGHVMAYGITRDGGFKLLWDYDPDASVDDAGNYVGVKGCFYFHAPVVAEESGRRMLYIGSYEGYVYALDITTGQQVWVKRLIDLGENNIPHPGTPGSVGSVAVTGDGRLIVSCSDGGLSSQTGFIECISALDGNGPSGAEYYWKLNLMCGGVVVSTDCFYGYVQSSVHGDIVVVNVDGTSSPIKSAIYKFDLEGRAVWSTGEYQVIKAALTMADGVLYANDYSAGSFYPSGGAVTAISAADGSEIWRLRLTPYSDDSYSMVSATVIDGRIYVGNDYGAVYCLSETAGPTYGDSGEIVLGNGLMHWSWGLLAIATAACFVFLYKHY